jgi:hypothetical protein
MDGLTLLRRARDAGLAVAAEGDKLVIRGPKRAEPVARLLIEHKPEVLFALSPARRPSETSHRWGQSEEERAAIVECGGDIRRAWAEGYARLHPDRPAAGVPLRRWQTFVDDVGRFLDGPFPAVASAHGWGPHDLFGCDRDRPFARIDQQGLCWLIAGNRLVDLAKNAAIIETWTGARQTFRRKPRGPGQVPAWELADGGRPSL